MFLFRKHLRKESVFETKEKLFQFLKRFFCFFAKKCQKQKILGWHAWSTIQLLHFCDKLLGLGKTDTAIVQLERIA